MEQPAGQKPSNARRIADLCSVIFMCVCILAYLVLCIVFAKQAESIGAMLVLLLLFFPTLPVITVTELVHRLTAAAEKRRQTELIGLVLSGAGSFLMCGFWLFMILQGGDRNIPMGTAVIAVNGSATLLLWIKRRIQRTFGE